MALAALIAAYHESGEAGHLRATLPLAGRTVVERQARLAASAGANPVVIVVERLPAALSAAVERLRRDRVPVKLVRSAEEAAEAVDPYRPGAAGRRRRDRACRPAGPARRGAGPRGSDRARRRAWRAVRADRRPVALGRPRRDRRRPAPRDRAHAPRLGPAIDPAQADAPGGSQPCRGGQCRRGRDPRPRPGSGRAGAADHRRRRYRQSQLVRFPARAGGAARHDDADREPGLASADRSRRGPAHCPRRGRFLCRLVLDRPDQIARGDAARGDRHPAGAAPHAGGHPPELVGLSDPVFRGGRVRHPRLPADARLWLGDRAAALRDLRLPCRFVGGNGNAACRRARSCSPSGAG